MLDEWINNFLSYKDLHPNRTGQSAVKAGSPLWGGRYNYDEKKDIETKNLGFGWMYYSIARLYKPETTVMIGSGRGFLPIIVSKGMKDNNINCKAHFIDPSLDDDFWKDSEKNKEWFKKFEIDDVIIHHLLTTQEFVKTDVYKNLKDIKLLCIDASHFYEFVKFDWIAFKDKLSDDAIILFHDTISRSKNPKWSGPRKVLLEILKDNNLQSFDFNFGAGLTLVQKKFFEISQEYIDKLEKEWPEKNDVF